MSELIETGINDNAAAGIAYVTCIPAIIFLLLDPYKTKPYVRFHAFQSIFLNIAWVILWFVVFFVTLVFRAVPFLGFFITAVLNFVLGLGGFIMWLYMMFKTYNGEKIVLPVIGPMAEKQAGV